MGWSDEGFIEVGLQADTTARFWGGADLGGGGFAGSKGPEDEGALEKTDRDPLAPPAAILVPQFGPAPQYERLSCAQVGERKKGGPHKIFCPWAPRTCYRKAFQNKNKRQKPLFEPILKQQRGK